MTNPTYLHELTFRLAAGVANLPADVRDRHANFLLSRQRADGGFAGREGDSDLYYTGFALRSLAMLGALDPETDTGRATAERAASFLRGKFMSQAPIVDFLSLIYGAMLLEVAAGIDVFESAPAGWRQAVAQTLERLRRPDGGYAKTDEGQSSSTYQSFLVILCLQIIEQPIIEPERLVSFVLSRRREDGGFVEIGPAKNSGTNPTAAAIGLLRILNAIDEPLREELVDFLADMQSDEGGFCANSRIPVADVLSTFTATLSLADLGGLDAVNTKAILRFVRSLDQPGGGFLAGEWDQVVDVEYTFYGLGALALLTPPAE